MLRFRILRYVLLTGSIIGFLLPLCSDYLRRRTVDRYDLRWHQKLDKDKRLQTISVRNAGNQSENNLILDFDFGAGSDHVSELETSIANQNPYSSILDVVALHARSPTWLSLTQQEKSKLLPLLDRQSNSRQLNEIDKVLDELLRGRLTAQQGSATVEQFDTQVSIPSVFPCKQRESQEACAKMNDLLVDWKLSAQAMLASIRSEWKSTTGLKIEPESDRLSFERYVSMSFSLGPGEERVLRIRYSHLPVQASTFLRSASDRKTVQVAQESDLYSTMPALFFKLHPFAVAPTIILLICILYFAPLLVPPSFLSTKALFNMALDSQDHDVWKHVLDRHRFFILQQFRELKRRFNPSLTVDAEEIVDYVRNGLEYAHRKHGLRLTSTADMNTYIHNELRFLVQNAK
jgi:hypothetical protein